MLFSIISNIKLLLQSKKSIILSLGNVPGLTLVYNSFNTINLNSKENIILNADYSWISNNLSDSCNNELWLIFTIFWFFFIMFYNIF